MPRTARLSAPQSPKPRVRHRLAYAGVVLACFLLAIPGMAYRISVEEKALAVGLGQPYRDYMQRTGRLFPRLK